MAAVARPRNNIQEHLAWFHSRQPQIPPQGQRTEYIQTVAAATTATPQIQATIRTEHMLNIPTQPVPKNPSIPMAQRTESRPQHQKVEFIPPDEIRVPTSIRAGALERFKNDDTRTGALFVV
jgi:hypothetical protein